MLLRDTATPRLGLPPPKAVLAGSPPESRKGRGGNLGHVSRPGSEDNVRVVRPKHKALFAHRKCLEVPDPLMEVSAVRSAVLADRYPLLTCSLSSTESSGSQGPL